MKNILIAVAMCLGLFAQTSNAQILIDISDDFDSAVVDTASIGNQPLTGTQIRSINGLGLQIVDVAATPALTGVPNFSGNAVAVSTNGDGFAAIGVFPGTPAGNGTFTFPSAPSSDPFTLSFDLFIPGTTDLAVPVGDFQPRFNGTGGGNGTPIPTSATSSFGFTPFVLTGTLEDFSNVNIGDTLTQARPFIGFNQVADTSEPNIAFIDNIVFTVGEATMMPPTLKGDVDLSGTVDFGDIPAFIAVLQSNGSQAEADTDCNGTVNFADIPEFINILQGG